MRRIIRILVLLVIVLVILRLAAGLLFTTSDLLTYDEVGRVESILANRTRPAQDRYGYPIDTLDRRELLRLLRDKQYDSLEAQLAERWESTKTDIRNEARLTHAYDAFVQIDPAVEPRIEQWMEARPSSPEARVAMAAYRWGMALDSRGGLPAVTTSRGRFASASEQAAAGLMATDEALRLSPDHLTAYIVRIELLQLSSGREDGVLRETLQAALAAHPTSFQLRLAVMDMLKPRWGGSLELMQQFAAASAEPAQQNEKLRALGGAVAQEEAFTKRNDYAASLALLDAAAAVGEHYLLLSAYGDLHLRHKRYVDALDAYEKALTLSPQGRSALEGRMESLVKIGALTADSASRDHIWAEAEQSLKLLQALRPPYVDTQDWWTQLDYAREVCRRKAAPCMMGI